MEKVGFDKFYAKIGNISKPITQINYYPKQNIEFLQRKAFKIRKTYKNL